MEGSIGGIYHGLKTLQMGLFEYGQWQTYAFNNEDKYLKIKFLVSKPYSSQTWNSEWVMNFKINFSSTCFYELVGKSGNLAYWACHKSLFQNLEFHRTDNLTFFQFDSPPKI